MIQDLSFEARNGAITGLLGANGAGKTTTFRMICGVLKPESGSISIDDAQDAVRQPQSQKRVGALLDHIGLYSRLTVRENLEYFGRLRGMDATEIRKRTEQVISILGLEAIGDRRTAGFSTGEQMKSALGRAMFHSPKNLLLDEPTNGLDIPTVRSLRDLLKRLRDEGMCVIFSSHVLEEVVALCDRIVVMADGRVAGQGTAAELCVNAETASLEDAFVKLAFGRKA